MITNGVRVMITRGLLEGSRGLVVGFMSRRRRDEPIRYKLRLESGDIVFRTDSFFRVLDNSDNRRAKPRPYGRSL